jgi:hypothetical protein
VTLKPGDLLYIPPLWFHHVTNINAGLSINVFSESDQMLIWDEVQKSRPSFKDLPDKPLRFVFAKKVTSSPSLPLLSSPLLSSPLLSSPLLSSPLLLLLPLFGFFCFFLLFLSFCFTITQPFPSFPFPSLPYTRLPSVPHRALQRSWHNCIVDTL